jgi:adenylate cyclase
VSLAEWHQMLTVPSRKLSFDQFTLDIVRCVLLRGALELPLRRQSFEVLRYLAEHAGKVVSGDELVEALWSSKPADRSASVGQCIKEIRRAIGDDARWIIKTVSGRGYEFKAEVVRGEPVAVASAPVPQVVVAGVAGEPAAVIIETPADSSDPAPALVSARPLRQPSWLVAVALSTVLVAGIWAIGPWRQPGLPESVLTMMAVPTLAVAPLETIANEHKAHAAFLGEQITQQLSRSPGGFELSVQVAVPVSDSGTVPTAPTRYILRGRVNGLPPNREVIVRLVERQSNRELWSDTFANRDDSAVRVVASQIARTAAVYIRVTESRRPLPARPEAGHYALMGRVLLESERGSEMNLRAMAIFDKAVALDGKHFYALQGYARTRVASVGNGWAPADQSSSRLDEAQRAVDAAIEVNQRSVGAHLLRGVIERIKGNSERSLASLEHARQFNPDYALIHAEIGRTKIDLGRSREALSDIARALELSPTDEVGAIWLYWAGIAAAHLGDDAAVLQWMNKALQRNRAYKEPLLWLAIAHARKGEDSRAREHIDEYIRQAPGFSLSKWLRLLPTSNSDVTRQRLELARVLEQLGVPEHPPNSLVAPQRH